MGPRVSAGKNVNAPPMTTTPTSMTTNNPLSVGKVPAEGGVLVVSEGRRLREQDGVCGILIDRFEAGGEDIVQG